MKKYLFILATAAIVASCAENDTFKDVKTSESKAIGFAAYSEKATKADNHTTLEFFYPTFNVYGWKSYDNGSNWTNIFDDITNEYFLAKTAQSGKTVSGNGQVIYTGSGENPEAEWGEETAGWYYQGIRYWDSYANAHRFSAYAPIAASAKVVCSPDGTIKIGDDGTGEGAKGTITVDNTNLMSTPATALAYTGFVGDYMTATTNAYNASPVALAFSHELAKINIQINLAAGVTTKQDVVVNDINITGLNGTSYFDNTEDVASPSAGYLDGWHTPTTAIAYRVQGPVDATTGYKMNGTTAGTDNFNTYYVMERLMIPQNIAKTTPANAIQPSDFTTSGAYIYVKYTIGTQEYTGYWGLANLFDATAATNINLKGGYEYTLSITVGPDPIYFTASVSTWTEETGSITF